MSKQALGQLVDRSDGLLIFDWIKQGAGFTRQQYVLEHRGLPAPQDFITRSIHCAYGTMRQSDETLFRESYTLELKIFEKIYYGVPLAAIPRRGVLFPWAMDWQRSDLHQIQKIPAPGELTIPRYIPPFCPFAIILTGEPVEVESLSFLPIINGLMDRPVQ